MEANLMFALSAADAPRRSLFAFHFELSRTPRRKPSSLVLRGAQGLMARFTMPRGSNKKAGLLSSRIDCFLALELAHALGTLLIGHYRRSGNRSQHWRAHMPPSGNKC